MDDRNRIWDERERFLKVEPDSLLTDIIKDDMKNYRNAEFNLRDDLGKLDKALALYIEVLQAAYY